MGVFGVPAGLTGSSGNILILLVILMVGLVVGGMIGILVCELFGFASEHPISGEKEYPNFFVACVRSEGCRWFSISRLFCSGISDARIVFVTATYNRGLCAQWDLHVTCPWRITNSDSTGQTLSFSGGM